MFNGLPIAIGRSAVNGQWSIVSGQWSSVISLPKIILIAFILLFSMGCKSTKEVTATKTVNQGTRINPDVQIDTMGKLAKIVFDSSAYHFGIVKQGQSLYREIYFTNLGAGDLLIDLISACECTTLDWSRLPIKAGSRSKIKITYNSKDKEGPQIVDIDVTANTNPGSTFTKFYLFVEK